MSNRPRKRIYLFGKDLAELRAAVETSLAPENPLVRCFGEQAECLDRLSERPCDLLLLDLEGSEEEGIQILTAAKRMAPWIVVVAIVSRSAVGSAVRAVRAGACDCLEKPVQEQALCAIVQNHLGRISAGPPRPRRPLTQMEVQVLERILSGQTSKDIATELHRSKRTIDVHRKNVVRKLGACGTVDLIKRALGMGFSDATSGRSAPKGAVPAEEESL